MLKTPDTTNMLAELYQPIERELAQVEEILRDELSSSHPPVNELLSRSNRLSGKRLRPALLLLFARACGKISIDHLTLAAAMEMVHTATLVHDDILDSADQRRHHQTINSEFGNQAAVLTGDYLFSHAFYLTSTLATPFAAREIGKATNRVCEGEIRQIGTRERLELEEKEYLEIIDSKTAVLCSCSAKLGAHYAAGSDPMVAAASRYGTSLGIAFQIVDDLLDILGCESEAGKSLGTDLDQCKPTLPVIHCLASLNESSRTTLKERLLHSGVESEEMKQLLFEQGSIEYTKSRANEFAQQASQAISIYPESRTRKILERLPSFVLQRTH
ncbi:MAG: polyprenyl synthetase family protein [Planctomycetota bacterium]|nr:polyprenyl synthetase family protein [Planctomycetota bacterium]